MPSEQNRPSSDAGIGRAGDGPRQLLTPALAAVLPVDSVAQKFAVDLALMSERQNQTREEVTGVKKDIAETRKELSEFRGSVNGEIADLKANQKGFQNFMLRSQGAQTWFLRLILSVLITALVSGVVYWLFHIKP